MKRVTITNMTGARNAGCDALVSSIILGVQDTCGADRVDIRIDSGDADYDAKVFEGRASKVYQTARLPLPRWPRAAQRGIYAGLGRAGAGRANGMVQSIANLRASDLLIATGGDVFTSDYGGLVNHARTLQVGRPVALLGQTIGPFTPSAEAHFRSSLANVAFCTVRESETLAYLNEKFPELQAEQTADVAFLLPATAKSDAERMLAETFHFPVTGKRLIGLSISSGILSFRSEVSAESYLTEMAAFVDDLNASGYSVIFIPHVQERAPRNNDIHACIEVLRRCGDPGVNLLLSLTTLSASDYKGIIGLCEALIGARTHATIASMSQGIPTVSIAYSRKAWGIMRDYYGPKLGADMTIDVSALNRDALRAAFDSALNNGATPDTAQEMKKRAQINFDRVKEHLFPRP